MPLFEEKGVDILRILADRGMEYCGRLDNYPYQLYLFNRRLFSVPTFQKRH